MKFKYLIITSFLLTTILTSCNDFLDLTPKSEASVANYFKTKGDLETAINACYGALQSTSQYGEYFITLMELRADNVTDINPGGASGIFYNVDNFTATSDNSIFRKSWKSLYNQIFRCNSVLDNINVASEKAAQEQIEGEARFLRALAYFNIVRLWGKAPLIKKPITTEEARSYGRNEISDIYTFIENELTKAASFLPRKYNAEKTGAATSAAAKALLAKVYLTQQKWSETATLLKNFMTEYQDLYHMQDEIVNVFDTNNEMNSEIIFAVRYSKTVLGEGHGFNDYLKDKSLMNDALKGLYENTDERINMINYRRVDANNNVIGKYYDTFDSTTSTVGFDLPLLRYSDILLMYAEAKNEIAYEADNNGEAMVSLNLVRERAKASTKTILDLPNQQSFREAIQVERRLEFPFELHRWFDLTRTNTAINAMAKLGYTITKKDYIYPVPQTEIDYIGNSSFQQNEGY